MDTLLFSPSRSPPGRCQTLIARRTCRRNPKSQEPDLKNRRDQRDYETTNRCLTVWASHAVEEVNSNECPKQRSSEKPRRHYGSQCCPQQGDSWPPKIEYRVVPTSWALHWNKPRTQLTTSPTDSVPVDVSPAEAPSPGPRLIPKPFHPRSSHIATGETTAPFISP